MTLETISLNCPDISILMNCFNGEKYIRNSIESVLAQTYPSFELLIWDNVSQDNSAAIVAEYKDSRIRYVKAPNHTTLAEARRQAFDLLRANWIAILDVDDLWYPEKLEHQMKCVRNNPDVGFVYCATKVLQQSDQSDPNHVFTRFNGFFPEGSIYKDLLRGNFISIASLLINKEKLSAIGGFSGKYPIMEDYYVTLNLARLYPVSAVHRTLCEYRVHGSNASLNGPIDTFEDLAIVRALFPDPSAIMAAARIVARHIKKCISYSKRPQISQLTRTLLGSY